MRRIVVAVYAALVVLLLAAPKADAQNCRYTGYAANVYHAPVYQQAVVQYDYNTIIVPKAFQVQVATPYYLGVADDYRQAFNAKAVAEELAKIIDLQRQALAANGAAPLPLTTQKPTSKIGAILANRCASCHAPGKQEPDLSGDPEKISEVVRLKTFAAIARGEMPKGKPPIPQDEFNEVGAWSKLKPSEVVPPIPPAKRDPEPKKEVLVEPKEKHSKATKFKVGDVVVLANGEHPDDYDRPGYDVVAIDGEVAFVRDRADKNSRHDFPFIMLDLKSNKPKAK